MGNGRAGVFIGQDIDGNGKVRQWQRAMATGKDADVQMNNQAMYNEKE